MTYTEVVQFLESLPIMPKTMPGLDKMRAALKHTDWFESLNPEKIIVVAGTNGKGTTCAALEALLTSANQKVGFYSSPHLVTTTERIRVGQKQIAQNDFIKVFNECLSIIKKCELSHFESLTLMAGHYFFSKLYSQNLDYIIFEVGLGGTFDATNVFPHSTSIITTLSLDHTNILGSTLKDIAQNKFGIVQKNNLVVHHQLPDEVLSLKNSIQEATQSKWIAAIDFQYVFDRDKNTNTIITKYSPAELNLLGERAAQNVATALTVFEYLGFDPRLHLKALNQIQWQGRMQHVQCPKMNCPLYLSGDHNPEGIASLVDILNNFSYDTLHLVVGIGVDKDAEQILEELLKLKNVKLHLTVTPFKGRTLSQYPPEYIDQAVSKNENIELLLNNLATSLNKKDLVVVTGSLYLVGEVLKLLN